jgi:hypothetical protein
MKYIFINSGAVTTDYSMWVKTHREDSPGFETWWAQDILCFIPIQPGTGAHPASSAMGAGALSQG